MCTRTLYKKLFAFFRTQVGRLSADGNNRIPHCCTLSFDCPSWMDMAAYFLFLVKTFYTCFSCHFLPYTVINWSQIIQIQLKYLKYYILNFKVLNIFLWVGHCHFSKTSRFKEICSKQTVVKTNSSWLIQIAIE